MCVLGVRQLVLGQKLRVRSPQEYQCAVKNKLE